MKALLLTLMLSSAALAEETTFAVDPSDPALQAATQEALTTLPTFLEQVVGPRGVAKDGAAIKACFQTGDTAHPSECFWFAPFILLPDGKIAGMSMNAGVYAKEIKADQALNFDRTQVADWGWRPGDGKAWGEYTTRAIFAAEELDAAALLGLPFSDTPLPPEWK
ncbi:DUF2314 domain-containing protein [Rhodobacter sp. KR11]|jgi:uncharacterized protein YegJ (DUF2314 family)|uniref:DUF2314 domain-containing protein n=1 Tax=Rhodobacter sp. KR11 TaxID=2974588 RepID=UPI002222EB28|nr:DUF2314 domain-containing protein [Rhodobacter sp. KR11]MCW1920612.1 DUF2314 domain-containing protein [Rhodobacter sp. KR11]